MPQSADRNELTLMLARAFDEAWDQYYLPHRSDALSENIARPLLARHLVALAKQGFTDEDALAAAGLEQLTSLTSAPRQPEALPDGDTTGPQPESQFEAAALHPDTLHGRLDQASATFIPGWRIPSRRLG